VLGGDPGLAAERAADVRSDHPHPVGGETGVGRDLVARHVRLLGRDVRRELAVAGPDDDGVALDRGRGDALVLHPDPHHVGRVAPGVALVVVPAGRRDVAADLLELQRRPGRQGELHIGDRRQDAVVDVHELGCVHCGGAGLGDHDGDRVTDVADLLAGERSAARGGVDLREGRKAPVAELGGREDTDHARGSGGRRGVDRLDERVRDRAAHEHRVEQIGVLLVVDERGASEQQLGILDAAYDGAQQRARHGLVLSPGNQSGVEASPRWKRSPVRPPDVLHRARRVGPRHAPPIWARNRGHHVTGSRRRNGAIALFRQVARTDPADR
jgi:hypothetical protein